MSDFKFSLRWAISGVVLGLLAFSFNYHFVSMTFIGYEVIAAPAMFALSFFSEETDFWPKMAIFIGGQYLAFVAIFFVLIKIKRAITK